MKKGGGGGLSLYNTSYYNNAQLTTYSATCITVTLGTMLSVIYMHAEVVMNGSMHIYT